MHMIQIRLLSRTGGGILGDGLATLGHGVLGQLTRQEETHGCLDLSTSQSGLVVVAGKINGLVGESLEDIVHE